MVKVNKYDFSFTASSLRRNEMVLVARSRAGSEDRDVEHELGGGKSATGKRILRECNKRLAKLTERQIDLLINGDLITQKQIAFLAICKVHAFIRDFVVEVMREKLLVFDQQLSEGEYISFFRRKAELHAEIENLALSTQKKIKQVTYKILEQAELIDNVKNKGIQPQIMDDKVMKAIAQEDIEWLKIFLMSDLDIKNLTI